MVSSVAFVSCASHLRYIHVFGAPHGPKASIVILALYQDETESWFWIKEDG